MPDRDIIERGPLPGWYPAYDLLQGGQASPEEVAAAINKSLAKSLRDGGGVPGLHEATDVISLCRAGLRSPSDARDRLRSIGLEYRGNRHTKVLDKRSFEKMRPAG